MAYAIATIKRTAQKIVAEGQPVTVPRLAAKLSTDDARLRSFIERTRGLKKELNLVNQKVFTHRRYTRSAERLLEARVIVTDRRVAALSGATTRAVRTWFFRHPLEADRYGRISEHAFKAHRKVQQLRWALWYRSATGMRITICHLAKDLGWDRTSIHKMFRKNPGLRQELGI